MSFILSFIESRVSIARHQSLAIVSVDTLRMIRVKTWHVYGLCLSIPYCEPLLWVYKALWNPSGLMSIPQYGKTTPQKSQVFFGDLAIVTLGMVQWGTNIDGESCSQSFRSCHILPPWKRHMKKTYPVGYMYRLYQVIICPWILSVCIISIGQIPNVSFFIKFWKHGHVSCTAHGGAPTNPNIVPEQAVLCWSISLPHCIYVSCTSCNLS